MFKCIDENFQKYIRILEEFVEIPSVSAWGEGLEAASYVKELLEERGFKVQVKSYGGNPIVYGVLEGGSKSLTIYNHYDVQPPDPVELWESDPFKLVLKNGKVYGRGVADNKGNIVARIAAVECLQEVFKELDLTLKYVIEGEEEIGSPTLLKFIEEFRGELHSNGGIWETSYIGKSGRLKIPLGFKGMLYLEIRVKRLSRDVHSGMATILPNPAWDIVRILSSLRSEKGEVKIPGFYEGLKDLGYDVEELLKDYPFEEEDLKKELGIREFIGGVSGLEALKKLHLQPSLNISGLYAGYTGKGSKTIVPALAGVKIDVRTVPGQDPERLLRSFREYLEELGYKDVEVIVHGSYPSGYTKPSEEIVRESVAAAEEVYGLKPVLIPLSPGSGPIYLFTDVLNTPMTGAGVGYWNSKVHSPNENIRIADFKNSIKHVALTILRFSKK